MELVVPLACPIVSNVTEQAALRGGHHIKRKLHCLKHYKDIVKKAGDSMRELLNHLKCREETERSHIAMVLTSEAEDYMSTVKTLEKRVKDMIVECEKNLRWFNRMKLGEEAEETISGIMDQKDKWSKLQVMYHQAQPSYRSTVPREFIEYDSSKEAINKVIRSLKDENTHIISVFGTGGVGKSTLLDQIGRIIEDERMFDVAVYVELSTEYTLGKIQELIAAKLQQEFSASTVEQRSIELATRLNMSKVLIMLDNVWTELDLRKIGIPLVNNGGKCKVLLATRIVKVCSGINAHIPINFLSKEDSFDLFRKKARLDELTGIQRDVAKECSGLPLALAVVGTALDGEDKAIWHCALRHLRESKPPDLTNVEENLFKCLELSYNYLNRDDWKLLFLICSLFPEGHTISEEELTWYGIGTDILKTYRNLGILTHWWKS